MLIPNWGEALGRGLSGVSRRPIVFFALLVAISALAYCSVGVGLWSALGNADRGKANNAIFLIFLCLARSALPAGLGTVSDRPN